MLVWLSVDVVAAWLFWHELPRRQMLRDQARFEALVKTMKAGDSMHDAMGLLPGWERATHRFASDGVTCYGLLRYDWPHVAYFIYGRLGPTAGISEEAGFAGVEVYRVKNIPRGYAPQATLRTRGHSFLEMASRDGRDPHVFNYELIHSAAPAPVTPTAYVETIPLPEIPAPRGR